MKRSGIEPPSLKREAHTAAVHSTIGHMDETQHALKVVPACMAAIIGLVHNVLMTQRDHSAMQMMQEGVHGSIFGMCPALGCFVNIQLKQH